MIYLITGVPGSGKTLYAVSTLIRKLAAEVVKHEDKELTRRVLVDGIPNLLIEHEPLCPIVENETGGMTSAGDSLLNWMQWCKPGDLIVIDEIQRYWRPRGMGTKPPDMIKALETHRHKGVDFVIITQNPMLIDQNVRRLVGRHQHVRRLFGMPFSIIYDWDGCSVDVHRTKSATSQTWRYPKDAFKLYKSAEVHTKQKQKIPFWLAVPVLGILGAVFVAPSAYSTMSAAMGGKVVKTEPAKPASRNVELVPPLALGPTAPTPAVPSSAPETPVKTAQAPAVGCAYTKAKGCSCFDGDGKRVDPDPQICEAIETVKPIDPAFHALKDTLIHESEVAHHSTAKPAVGGMGVSPMLARSPAYALR